MRTIRAQIVEFDSTGKIRETDSQLVLPTVFTRESILPFAEGRGYRPAGELAHPKAVKSLARAFAVPYVHISTVFVQSQADICGTVENVRFDDNINGLVGDLSLDKADCDANFLEGVRSGSLKDVSVAYISDEDWTPGRFSDEAYDFVQRSFVFGHVAVGVPEGRCPSPFCGMNVDAFIVKPRMDPEETEEFVHVRVKDPDLFVEGYFRTIEVDAGKGIKAVVGKLKSAPKGATVVQKFIFTKAKGWTMERAQAWVKEHKDSVEPEPLPSTSEGLGVRGSPLPVEVLDPSLVLARCRRLLGNMPPVGGRTWCYDWRGMVRSPPRRGDINGGRNEQVEYY